MGLKKNKERESAEEEDELEYKSNCHPDEFLAPSLTGTLLRGIAPVNCRTTPITGGGAINIDIIALLGGYGRFLITSGGINHRIQFFSMIISLKRPQNLAPCEHDRDVSDVKRTGILKQVLAVFSAVFKTNIECLNLCRLTPTKLYF